MSLSLFWCSVPPISSVDGILAAVIRAGIRQKPRQPGLLQLLQRGRDWAIWVKRCLTRSHFTKLLRIDGQIKIIKGRSSSGSSLNHWPCYGNINVTNGKVCPLSPNAEGTTWEIDHQFCIFFSSVMSFSAIHKIKNVLSPLSFPCGVG